MLQHVTAVSYLICAGAYVLAVCLILTSGTQHRYKPLLVAACAITSIWAAVIGGTTLLIIPSPFLPLVNMILEQLRSGIWIIVIGLTLYVAYGERVGRATVGVLAVITLSAMLYSAIVAALSLSGIQVPTIFFRGVYLAHVLVAVVALLLIENLFRNCGREARWSVKYLCFGLGVVFCYDFFVYAEAGLLGHLDDGVYAARGIVATIAMPLMILSVARSESWPSDVHISRSFVFHSATLLSAGVYLMAMAAAGYSLRVFDSPWGTVSQASFLVAALLVLAIILSSGEAQARLKSFISQNFFSYRYDYRIEWLRFIDGISDSATDLTIPERVVQALANIVGSTAGNIWVKCEEDRVFRAVGPWNMAGVLNEVPVVEPWIEVLAAHAGVIDLKRKEVDGKEIFQGQLPEWLVTHPQAVMILPLVNARGLTGFVVLGEMRAPRALDWEDFDLLKTAARQAASYIAEENAAQALAQVRRFEDFNLRFAFIVHDVKNLAAQMTLILRNAERHGDNPEFQKDMLQTVRGSVGRLRAMLEQLRNPLEPPSAKESVDLVWLLHEVAVNWRLQHPNLESVLPVGPVSVLGQMEQLRAVVSHLIQNALDAAGPNGKINLGLHIEGVLPKARPGDIADDKRWAVITVTDDGPGMDRKFIENDLFRPLRSGKTEGFGIGAFQARQFAREMGGSLEVDSECGCGTRILVRLPYAPSSGEMKRNEYERSSYVLKSA